MREPLSQRALLPKALLEKALPENPVTTG